MENKRSHEDLPQIVKSLIMSEGVWLVAQVCPEPGQLSSLHGRLYSQMAKNFVGPGSQMVLRDWKEEVLGDSKVSGLGET